MKKISMRLTGKLMRRAAMVAAFGLCMATAACEQTGNPQPPFFAPDTQARQETKLMDAQRAAGERQDATLYPQHFDGSGLSSLGTAKLDYMLDDDRSLPVVVYLDVPESPMNGQRQNAVQMYLMDRGGLHADQIKFESGPNPATYSSSAVGLTNLERVNSNTDSAGAAGPASK